MKLFLKKIIGTIKKNKIFFYDAVMNMTAFMVYVCSQQILLLPVMAKLLDSNTYANLILYITIMNVFCNVFGGQLGVTHQLQKPSYVDCEVSEHSDFSVLMIGASLIIALCFPVILCFLKFDVASVVFITLTCVLSNFRLYIRYHFRITSNYRHMVVQNLLYLFGIVCGILLYQFFELMWLPLLIGETFAFVYTLLRIPVKRIQLQKTVSFVTTLKRYSALGSADALVNLIAHIDRIMVYPLLGARALAVYNSGSATSKVAALVVVPLNEVVLVKLSKMKDSGRGKLLRSVILISLIASAVIFILLIPTVYMLSFILYRQYLEEICTILVFLSLTCSVGFTATVLKSFILRYAKPIQITICYIVNVVLLAILSIIGASYWGLTGFAVAVTLAKIELWLSFVCVLYKCVKEDV